LEIERRKKYLKEHGTNSYSNNTEKNPFASKIVCGNCNKVFARKGWRSSTGVDRKVWQCSERYKIKGIIGKNAGKDIYDGLECFDHEPGIFFGEMAVTKAE